MLLEHFDYPLPDDRIAQTPVHPRDSSRLMRVAGEGRISHHRFRDLPTLLTPGDLLIVNDSRVLPARLFGSKPSGARVELLLLQRREPAVWEALAYPGRRLRTGAQIVFGDGLRAEVIGESDEGSRIVRFLGDGDPATLDERARRLGEMPLPPYIHTRLDDPERYQTLYAREEGSAAAPTAGLHFTDELIRRLEEGGVGFAAVTLHVGIATFRPVKCDRIEDHVMHAEWYSVPQATVDAINNCRGRVVCVGTTTLRALESAAAAEPGRDGRRVERESTGLTRLYITPGHRFRTADLLITNFHMPRSSLLILVSAFAGFEVIRQTYETALAGDYRFLSFGDAMLLERAAPVSDG